MSDKIMKQHHDRLHQRAETRKFRKKILQFFAVGAALSLAMFLVLTYINSETLPSSKVDPLSGKMDIEAPGCVITGPDGKSLKEAISEQIKAGGKIFIPQGSTLNSDCFPDAKAARAADSKSMESN